MTAYTNATNIAAYLGTTLTADQQTQAALVAQAISDWIDRETNQSWQQASPATDELHTLTGNRVYLNHRPVVAVTSVKTRAAAFTAFDWTTLDASQYELLDAANGLLLIEGWSASSAALVQVSYTYTLAIPSEIALAATILASDLMTVTLHPEAAGVSQIAVGQNDISVKYADASAVPPAVSRALEMVRGRRSFVIA
ncbi:MAG TPA: hypothetical protein VFV93_02465 [Thermomicrobiales bacterium]|nr:hypothetical protein [Thermomicrobiales bacterium]